MTKHRNDEQRKDQICRAAARCFLRRGFAATRLLDIAREAGMSKGGIYFHFRAKEDLVREILVRHARGFEARVAGFLEAGLAPEDVLLHILREHLLGTGAEGGSASVAMMLLSLAPHSEACREALAEYTASLHRMYAKVCERGIRAGSFRAGEAETLADIVLGVVHGTAAAALAAGTPLDRTRANAIGRQLLALLRGTSRAKRPVAAGQDGQPLRPVEFAR